ncbi:glycosyltransferase family 2 protein, partial (plasmid) [Weissella cibaria]
MKFSVIMPVYNVQEYLDRSIMSVLSQSLQDIELIIINDGSTDGSHSIIDYYLKKDIRIKYIQQDNKGVSE